MSEFQPVTPYFDSSGVEWSLSPSQIEVFDEEKEGCQRKWALNYIGGMKAPAGKAAALGSSVHAVLERFLIEGELPDQSTREGQIATAGLHFLPPPASGVVVEDSFSFRSPAGYLYRGRIDFQWQESGSWYIGDHKTTSDFRWIKQPETLAHDTQAVIYAAQSLLASGDPYVNLRWVYYRTRGAPKSEPIEIRLTEHEVAERFLRIDELGAKIHLALHTVTDPMTVSPNPEACQKFGGCPHQHLCGDVRTSIGDMFMNLPGFPGAPASLPPATLPGAGVPPPNVDAQTAALLAQLAALQATPPAPTPAAAPVPDVLAALRAAQAGASAAPPALPPVAAPPSSPASLPPVASPVQVPVSAPIPGAGTWTDPTCAGNMSAFLYPCHCGAQITGAQCVALPDLGAGERACPNCNRRIAGSGMIAAGLVQAINPPEAAQQIAVAPSLPAATPAGPPPNPETPKRGGRPAGSKNKPKNAAGDDTDEQSVTVSWGKETYVLGAYASRCEVGPFERTEYPNDGETQEAARVRIHAELAAWAEQERARKIASFVATLPKS